MKELLSRRPDWANLPGLQDTSHSFRENSFLNSFLDNYGFSPLHYAATEGFYEICSMLLEAGANPNIQTNNSWVIL